jgi:dTDP-4-dehydrorhamnose 3,5-epimerase
MTVEPTNIKGVVVVKFEQVSDHRGQFQRLFCNDTLSQMLDGRKIVQINRSCTYRVGTVRGLHFQRPPYAELKMIQCLRGRVWDVVVDLRAGSPTLLHWHSEVLSPDQHKMIVIPEGCAHGFQILESNSQLLYFHTAPYQPEAEGGVPFNDPLLEIRWPLNAVDLSSRDQQHPPLYHGYTGIKL